MTATAADVLAAAKRAGLTLTLEEGGIRVWPSERASDGLLWSIARRKASIMRLMGDVDRPSPMAEALHEYRDRLAEKDLKKSYIWTGYNNLDYLLGGTGPGYYTVVAARPKMGKSAFGLQWARHVARVGHVLFFTFEMEFLELAQRNVCQETRVGSDYHSVEDVDRALKAAPRIWLYSEGRKLEDVIRRIRVFRLRHGDQAAAVFVDQVGHLRTADRERTATLLRINGRLKEVAMEERLPIIGLHQISRGAELRPDKRPTLADLKDSGSFEEYANQVILLYRPGYYDRKSTDNSIEVTVAANRAGRDGVAKLVWHPSSTRFEEPSPAPPARNEFEGLL